MLNASSHHLASLPAEHVRFIEGIITRHGPELHEHGAMTRWFDRTAEYVREGRIARAAVAEFWREVTHACFPDTMQGHVVRKPHGYAGDFEIIDRIYLNHVSEDENVRRWDEYFHAQHAPRAVRNRKSYLHDWLHRKLAQTEKRPLRLLNIGSGPARDVREWCEQHEGPQPVHFDCVDMDAKAIAHGQALCAAWPEAVRFTQANSLRFTTEHRYDLVWSAGLFDYLSDGLFVRLLKRLMRLLDADGELVIGNFGTENPTRFLMETWIEWVLLHRSEQELARLAEISGLDGRSVHVDSEVEGVNLFLHARL